MEEIRRVMKNSSILYARMAITVVISLYTTRIILAALGASDFGLFNLVGGAIAMLGFLNNSMASATQRFLSFTQGSGDFEKILRIFNMSSILHWGIALVVFFLLELFGYIFFNGVLNILPERIQVAKIIYQFLVVSTIFSVISVPYDAVITSHENMTFYAFLGILEAFLKLIIAYYISISNNDHLILYGFLMAILTIFLLAIRIIYCHKKYEECHLNLKKYFDRVLLKDIGIFAGWTLMGTSTGMVANYGSNIIINIFFGTIINASQAISNQISAQLSFLATTINRVVNPIIDKSLGAGNRSKMLEISIFSTKLSYFFLAIIYIPILIQLPYLLKLWLVNVPSYALIFCCFQFVRNLIEQLYLSLALTINAAGELKKITICNSILSIFPLPITYVLFHFNYSPSSLGFVYIVYAILNGGVVIYFVNKINGLSIEKYFSEILCRLLLISIATFAFSYSASLLFLDNLFSLISSTSVAVLTLFLCTWFWGTNLEEKLILKKIIFKKVEQDNIFS